MLPLSSSLVSPFFFLMLRPPSRTTLFPYTTLFRSHPDHQLRCGDEPQVRAAGERGGLGEHHQDVPAVRARLDDADRKSTRLNSSHQIISYAVFCLKKKKYKLTTTHTNPNTVTKHQS